MAFRDWLKEYRGSQGSQSATTTKPSAATTSSSGTTQKSTSGSSGSGSSGSSFRDTLKEYREKQATISLQGWADTSINLINDTRNNANRWHDDDEYQSRSDRFTSLLGQADQWRKQYAGNKEAISYINSVVDALSEAKTYSFNSRQYFAQWDTKDQYDFWQDHKTVESRQQWYAEQEKRLEELKAQKKSGSWFHSPGNYEAGSPEYLSAEAENAERLQAINDEISAIETEMRNYKRGNYNEYGQYYGNKALDDYYDVTKRPDFAVSSANRDYDNPTREELWEYDTSVSQGSVALSGGGSYDDEGNIVDAKGNIVTPANAPEVEDKLGLFLSGGDEGVTEAYNLLSAGNGNVTNTWANIMQEGDVNGWKYLEDTEIAIYYALLDDSQEAAYKFLSDMAPELNRRETMAFQDYVEEAPVLEQIFLNVASIPMNVIGGGVSFVDDAINVIQGEEINPYNRAHAMQNAASAIREDTAKDINNLTGNVALPFVGTTFGDAYQAIMSAGDMAFGAALGGGTYEVLMGMGAASSKAKDLYDKGASMEQIVAGGILAGAAETFFEHASIENLRGVKAFLESPNIKPVDFIKKVLAQSGVEASEEMLTEFANTITDAMVMGSQSDLQAYIDKYIAQGDSGALALTKALLIDTGKNVLNAGIGGFISGGFGGGATAVAGYSKYNQETKNTGRTIMEAEGGVDALKALAMDVSGADSKLAKQAEKVTGETFTGEGLVGKAVAAAKTGKSQKAVGKLYASVQTATAAQNKADIAKSLEENGFSHKSAKNIADAIMARVNGEELSKFQKATLEAVKDNEKVQEAVNGILEDAGSSVNKRTFNLDKYSLGIKLGVGLAPSTAETGTPKAEKIAPRNIAVSENGKMMNTETNEVIDHPVLAQAEDGTYMVVDKNAGLVSSENVSYESHDQGMVVESFVNLSTDFGKVNKVIASMDLASRNKLLSLYNPAINTDGGMFVNGVLDAFFYGHRGVDLSVARKGSPINKLTEQQRQIAWETGRAAGEKATAAEQSNVDTVYAEAQKVLEQTGKPKNGTHRATLEAGISPLQLSPEQKAVYRLADEIAQGIQTNIRVYNGTDTAQGFYNHDTDEIMLNLNAANKGRDAIMAFTLAHEIVHRAKKGSPAKYQAFTEFLMKEYGKQGSDVETMIQEQMDAAERFNKTVPKAKQILMTEEKALEEVVCDACQRMLLDTDAGKKLAEFGAQSKENKGFLEDLKRWITELLEKLRNYFAGVDPDSKAAKEFAKFDENVKQILADMYVEMAQDAGEKLSTIKAAFGNPNAVLKANAEAISEDAILTDGAVVVDGEGKSYSIKSMKADIAEGKMFEDLKNVCGWTQRQVNELKQSLEELIEYMTPFRDILDMNETYGREGRRFSPYKPNSDPLYKISMDFSTLCSKRLLTQYVIENLQLRENRPMSAEEQIAIRDMLNEYRKVEKGLQVACAMCYVEAARLKSPKQINKWLDDPATQMRNYFADKNPEFANYIKEKQADFKESRGYDRNASKNDMKAANKKSGAKDVAELNKIRPRLRSQYQVSAEEAKIIERAKSLPSSTYLTAGNLATLSETDPIIYSAYTAFVRTATRSKSLETDEPYYYGDSTRDNGNGIVVSDSFIEAVNRENGMRFSSWSDWRIQHLLDYITAVIDNSVRGAAMHGYTKFGDEVRVLGKTGMMFNMSGVAGTQTGLNEDGSLSFSPTESIDVNEAIQLRDEFPETAGLQCIGVSKEHIIALLRSDYVDYIIPYHTSGLNAVLRRMVNIYGWDDFTGTQHAAIDKSVKLEDAVDKEHWREEPVFSEFFVGYDTGMTGIEAMRASADRYVQMCKDRGLKPKFEQFLGEENYWKLLIDRKMINQKTGKLIQQRAVTPTFEFGTIKEVVDRYVQNYDSGLEARALNHIVENWDSIPKRIRDLKKQGSKKTKKASKAVDTLANQTLAAQPKGVDQGERSYSLPKVDSDGNKLTEDQMEFFENSKARDENGNLYVLYHGSRSPLFTEFDMYEGVWLTPDQRYAEVYAEMWHTWRDEDQELTGLEQSVYADPDYRLYKMYANITNPLDIGEINDDFDRKQLNRLARLLGVPASRIRNLAYDEYGYETIAFVYQLTKEKEFIDIARDKGYDGFVATERGKKTFCAFNAPNQVKLTTNEVPSGFDDIRYSLPKVDTDGKQLTAEQQEFFKDSKVRDEEGRLIPMYHGTNTPNFTVFDPQQSDDHISLFFTSDPDVANTYTQLQDKGRDVDPYNLITKDSSAEQFNAAQERVGGGLRVVKITPEWIQEMKKKAEQSSTRLLGVANKYADLLEVMNEHGVFNYDIERIREVTGNGTRTLKDREINKLRSAMGAAKDHLFFVKDKRTREISRIYSDTYKLFDEARNYAIAAATHDGEIGLYTYTETNSSVPFRMGDLYPGSERDMVAKAIDRMQWVEEHHLGNRYKVYLNITNPYILDAGVNYSGKMDYVSLKRSTTGEGWRVEFENEEHDVIKHMTTPEFMAFMESAFDAKTTAKIKAQIEADNEAYRKEWGDDFYEDMDVDHDIQLRNVHMEYMEPGNWNALNFNGNENARTRDVAAWAKENGYDGVIFKNMKDTGGYAFVKGRGGSTVATAFNSDQVKSVDNLKPTSDPDIRYSLPKADSSTYQEPAYQEWDVQTALYDAMDHADKGDENLIRVGEMPRYITDKLGIEGDFYIYRNHAYENMVSRDKAIQDGRPVTRKGEAIHFHDLGMEKMIDAVMSLENPIMTISTKTPEGNPAVIMILPVSGKNKAPLYAVLSFYSNRPINGDLSKKPHIVLTIAEREFFGSKGRSGYAEIVGDAVKDGRVIDFNKEMRDALSVIANPAGVGNITDSSLAVNLSRFLKEIKSFREKNHIDYKLPVGEDTSPRALLANAFEGIITNDIEKRKIQEYKGKVEMLNAEEKKLSELRAQIKELSFAKGKRDTKKIKELQFDANHTANRIATLDKMLLGLEASTPLQNILKREKEMAFKRGMEKSKEKHKTARQQVIETREKRYAREKLQKLVIETAKWISYPSKTDVKCPDILKQPYADFLKGIDLSSKRKAAGGDPTKNDLRLTNAMDSLATALDRVMASQDPNQDTTAVLDTGYLDLPAGFVQKLRDMTESVKAMMVEGEFVVNTMTAAEVRQLSQIIRTLNHAIKEVSTLYANLRFANVEALGDETMSFIDDLGEIEKSSGMKDFVQWENALPYYAFKRFGNGGESIFEGLMDAQDKLAFLAQQIFGFSEKTWTDKEAKAWSEDTHTINLPDGDALTLTTADAMSIYCLSRREQGLKHLLGGGTRVMGIQKGSKKAQDSRSLLTIKDIDAIISSLTDRQRQVAEAIQEFMSTTCSEWGNEISMKRFLTKEFNEKFYFPIESNDENLPTKDPSAQQSDLFRLLNISATKPIDPRANNEVIIRNIFDVFTGHASDMARLNAFGMPLLDYMKWLNYREKTVNDEGQVKVRGVRKSMEKAYGNAAKSYVLNLIKDVNGRASDGGEPTILMKWMRTAKTASVGSSLRVATLQITSYPRAALVLSPKSLALGLSKLPKIDKAKKYCGIALWKSFGFYDTNISRSIEDQMKGVKDVKQKLIELSLKGAEWGDAITWGCLWNACEYEVAATGKYTVGTEEFYQAVGNKLREVVYATQVVDSTLTRSQMMRSKRGMAQEAAAFMSEPTLSANILMDAGFEFSMEKRRTGSAKAAWKKTGKYIGRAVAVYSIGQLTAALLEGLWDAWRDDEDEEFGEKYLKAFVENLALDLVPFNKIPIVSDVFEAALAMFGVGFYSSDKMSTTWLTQAVSAVDAWKDVLGGESSTTVYNALYKSVRAISSYYGVAFSGVMREGVALWNNTAGAIDSTLKVRQYVLSKAELGNELYEAIVAGDTKQAASLKAQFEDQNSMSSALRKALRENDPRIREAAIAWNANDLDEYMRIAKEIIAEKHFVQDDVVMAIRAEANELAPDEGTSGTSKAKGLFTAEKFAEAIAQGDQAMANAIMLDIIETAQKNGKTEEEAKKSFASSAKTDLKELFVAGTITEDQAINALTTYCDEDQDDAESRVESWAFEKEYGFMYSDRGDAYKSGAISAQELKGILMSAGGKTAEEADLQIQVYDWEVQGYEGATVAAVRDYNEHCSAANVPKDVYLHIRSFSNNTENDVDANGKTIYYSAMKKVMAEINAQYGLTSAQKDAIARSLGWAEKNIQKYKLW